VFVLLRVLGAFVAARTTRDQARLELRSQQSDIRVMLAGEHASGCDADVRAVHVQTNTASKHVDLGLAETCIGACTAALSAIEASLDAFRQSIVRDYQLRRAGLQHVSDVHDLLLQGCFLKPLATQVPIRAGLSRLRLSLGRALIARRA
jgi:hypothetical protein